MLSILELLMYHSFLPILSTCQNKFVGFFSRFFLFFIEEAFSICKIGFEEERKGTKNEGGRFE